MLHSKYTWALLGFVAAVVLVRQTSLLDKVVNVG